MKTWRRDGGGDEERCLVVEADPREVGSAKSGDVLDVCSFRESLDVKACGVVTFVVRPGVLAMLRLIARNDLGFVDLGLARGSFRTATLLLRVEHRSQHSLRTLQLHRSDERV